MTSSERKGILIIAGIALAITGLGLVFSFIGSNIGHEDNKPEITTVINQDSVSSDENEMDDRQKNKKNKSDKKSSSGTKKSSKPKKTYRTRNPLDEDVTHKR